MEGEEFGRWGGKICLEANVGWARLLAKHASQGAGMPAWTHSPPTSEWCHGEQLVTSIEFFDEVAVGSTSYRGVSKWSAFFLYFSRKTTVNEIRRVCENLVWLSLSAEEGFLGASKGVCALTFLRTPTLHSIQRKQTSKQVGWVAFCLCSDHFILAAPNHSKPIGNKLFKLVARPKSGQCGIHCQKMMGQ